MPENGTKFTAVVMAGTRPGGDPLAQAKGVAFKAMVPVAGEPMLLRVVRSLRASARVGEIVVCGLPVEALRENDELRSLLASGAIATHPGDSTPSRSVTSALRSLGPKFPFLVTTADHPLLSPEIVESFCAGALASGSDATIGMTSAAPVQQRFPGIRRTNHHFRDGAFCGCNLFGLLTPAAARGPEAWVEIEAYRKKPWRMVAALGPITLLRFALGRLSLADVMRLLEKKIDLRASVVFLPQPEAGFDVDSVVQLEAVEEYFRQATSHRSS